MILQLLGKKSTLASKSLGYQQMASATVDFYYYLLIS